MCGLVGGERARCAAGCGTRVLVHVSALGAATRSRCSISLCRGTARSRAIGSEVLSAVWHQRLPQHRHCIGRLHIACVFAGPADPRGGRGAKGLNAPARACNNRTLFKFGSRSTKFLTAHSAAAAPRASEVLLLRLACEGAPRPRRERSAPNRRTRAQRTLGILLHRAARAVVVVLVRVAALARLVRMRVVRVVVRMRVRVAVVVRMRVAVPVVYVLRRRHHPARTRVSRARNQWRIFQRRAHQASSARSASAIARGRHRRAAIPSENRR